MDGFDRKMNEVNIMITAPSDNENDVPSSGDEDEELDTDNGAKQSLHSMQDKSEETNDGHETTNNEEDKELCEKFDSGISLSEEKPSPEEKDSEENAKQNYEIVGDRVLVERDGKFELVDANEIKAEYFEMLGIKPEESSDSGGSQTAQNTDVGEEMNSEISEKLTQERPKTTPGYGTREMQKKSRYLRKNRVQSSWGERYSNSEYSKIRSQYGLTEKQLEIKKKREEAIARRKKEEEERRREEERRKREDAERAFQAWLSAKREEEKEKRKAAIHGSQENDKVRAEEAAKAFKAWKVAKKKQENNEREAATRKMEETASMYVVHDRGACEEAFKRWLKKKKNERRAKELDKKKKMKERSKPKEPLPVNSSKIRFTDNYGYRNTAVY